MTAQALSIGTASQRRRTDLSWVRSTLVRGLQAASRWLDQRAYALEYPEERVSVHLGPTQVEVARDPSTGFAVVYVNGERQFTIVRGLDRL